MHWGASMKKLIIPIIVSFLTAPDAWADFVVPGTNVNVSGTNLDSSISFMQCTGETSCPILTGTPINYKGYILVDNKKDGYTDGGYTTVQYTVGTAHVNIHYYECATGMTATKTVDIYLNSGIYSGSCCIKNVPVLCGCSCGDCDSDTVWKNSSDGYEKKETRECQLQSGTCQCVSTPQYRCARGYYGRSDNGVSGCTECPTPNGAGEIATTASAGATSIGECYKTNIDKKQIYSDNSGYYQLSGTQCGAVDR